MLDLQISPNPILANLLATHPRVSSVRVEPGEAGISWQEGSRNRAIYTDNAEIPLRGVVELIDNNPLVCADTFSVPSPAATLAEIAIGPLAEASLLVERPTMLVNIHTGEAQVSPFLAPHGWTEGLTIAAEPTDLGGAVAATVICAIRTPERLEDLDDLYEERYGRSFFVRLDEAAEWHVDLVLGKPYAVYRLRISPDEPHSLLTIQVAADCDGKCGAAQIVHAMNVMCGFEESLGIV